MQRAKGQQGTILFILLVGLAGCGGPPPSRVADADRAREALSATLLAWKGGDTPEALASRTPPIRVADDDWHAGLKLADYKVNPADKVVGTSLNCPVALTLKDAKGRPVRKKVVYHVDTDPTLMVVRQEGP